MIISPHLAFRCIVFRALLALAPALVRADLIITGPVADVVSCDMEMRELWTRFSLESRHLMAHRGVTGERCPVCRALVFDPTVLSGPLATPCGRVFRW